jgi:hypothetical protein
MMTAQPACSHQHRGAFPPYKLQCIWGSFEALPPQAFVEKEKDLQLLTNLKLLGDQVGFTEEIAKDIGHDAESSLL